MSNTIKNIQDVTTAMDETEFNAVLEEALTAQGGYTHSFKKPFQWQGKEYTSLHFDFESLTGVDMLTIERDMAVRGIILLSPTMSGHFLISMAARAAGVGEDMIRAMSIYDVNAIRSKARDFLLRSEV